MRKYLLVTALLALVVGAVVAGVSVTRATAMTTHHRDATAAGVPGGGCQRLMKDPKAMQVMHDLHPDHLKDIQAWRDLYGSDPSSTEAKQALTRLWREHRAEMKSALAKAGVKFPAGLCTRKMMRDAATGTGAGMMGAGSTDMMGAESAGMMGDSSGSLHEQHHSGTSGQASGMMGGADGASMMGGTY